MRRIALWIVVLLCLMTVRAGAQTATPRDYWPTDAWRAAEPEAFGMDGTLLAEIDTVVARDMPFARSVLVVRGGYIVYERYYNGADVDTLHSVRSVTKSVTSALVGIALENGDIDSLDTTAGELFPEYFENRRNDSRRTITFQNLLMMRSGLRWGEENWQVLPLWESDRDQMAHILGLPLENEPGTVFNYSTADTQLLSGMFTRATNRTLLEYARRYLFNPIGIGAVEWSYDAAGYNIGGAELKLTSRDMARFGYLYLNDGLWDETQVVPADWVTLTTTGQDEDVPNYGYLWWRAEHDFFGGYPAFAALGYAGQILFIYPDLDLVVVTTAEYRVFATPALEQEHAMMALIQTYIIPSVAS